MDFHLKLASIVTHPRAWTNLDDNSIGQNLRIDMQEGFGGGIDMWKGLVHTGSEIFPKGNPVHFNNSRFQTESIFGHGVGANKAVMANLMRFCPFQKSFGPLLYGKIRGNIKAIGPIIDPFFRGYIRQKSAMQSERRISMLVKRKCFPKALEAPAFLAII